MTELAMFDSVDLGLIPADAAAVAGYTAGLYPTFPELAARFPHARLLSIAVNSEDDAEALDVETGDATAADVPDWDKRQRGRGVARPCVYADASTMESGILPVLASAKISRGSVRLWSAHYTGTAHICGPKSCGAVSVGMDATQWTDQALGRDLDQSLLAADFFAVPAPPAAKATTANGKAARVTTVPIEIQDDSVLIHAVVNGKPAVFVLDTGDAVGPVFTQSDAARLGLVQGAPFGVEGAGGASTSYETTASITFDDVTYDGEPSAIDGDLQGDSLLGLPFFLAKCSVLSFDFGTRTLTLVPLAR